MPKSRRVVDINWAKATLEGAGNVHDGPFGIQQSSDSLESVEVNTW